MKLSDVKRLAIRNEIRVRFELSNGLECTVDEHGIGRVPKLAAPPEFSLDEEFHKATQFILESSSAQPRKLSRHELEQMTGQGQTASDAHGADAEE